MQGGNLVVELRSHRDFFRDFRNFPTNSGFHRRELRVSPDKDCETASDELIMARPKTPHPTPAELEILKILWDRGPLTVREVWDVLQSRKLRRAYTSVQSLLNVMAEKRLLKREPLGRTFRFDAHVSREKTVGTMLSDLWKRAYSGSTSALVAHLLDETQPSNAELQAIRETLQRFEAMQEPTT